MARNENIQGISKDRHHQKQQDHDNEQHRVDCGADPQKDIISRLVAAVNTVQSACHGQHALARRPQSHQRRHRDDTHGLVIDLIDDGDDQRVHG